MSAVLVFILVVIIIVVITIMWRRKKNIYAQQQHRPKTYKHGSNLVVHVEGDTEPHVYEMPRLYPEEPELTSCEVYNHSSTINRVRQAVPTTSLMSDNHNYDYPMELEIPTIPSVAYGHNSVIKPVRQDIPTTPCKAYDHNSAPDPFSRGITIAPYAAYDDKSVVNPVREGIATTQCIAYETH